MDISDSESDDYEVEATDDEWIESGKLQVRKRKSKRSMENNQSNISSEEVKDNSVEGPGGASGETASEACCSCSKSSSCKTTKCKCRALGSTCGSSCGCLASKCANREPVSNESQEPTQLGLVEGTGNDSCIEESDKDRLLATQGAELLHGALIDRPAETNNDHGSRKPLSDIGNTLVRQLSFNHLMFFHFIALELDALQIASDCH